MRALMLLVIVAVMLASYLSSPAIGLAPGPVRLLPDALAGIVALYVLVVGARDQFRLVDAKYWILFGALAVVVAAGPLVNGESPGPIVNGIRYYLRAIPFFFLPAVFRFSEQDLRRIYGLILFFCLVQVPIAIYQRLDLAARGHFTGDDVFGTVMHSGILSILLICALCILASLTVRGRFPKLWFGVCFLLLIIPMSINETKISLLVLPVALLATFYFASPPGRRLVVTASALGLISLGGAIFVPLYNYYNTLNNPVPMTVGDWFDSKTLKSYLKTDARVGSTDEAGRLDALTLAFREFSGDPIKLAFGVGLGNASQSSLGEQFSGRYQTLYWQYVLAVSMGAFLLEIGLLGALLVLALHIALLRDSLVVLRIDQGLVADVAPGYVGLWIAILVGLFYTSIHTFEVLSFLVFFTSGLLAARRTELRALDSKARATRRRTSRLTGTAPQFRIE